MGDGKGVTGAGHPRSAIAYNESSRPSFKQASEPPGSRSLYLRGTLINEGGTMHPYILLKRTISTPWAGMVAFRRSRVVAMSLCCQRSRTR